MTLKERVKDVEQTNKEELKNLELVIQKHSEIESMILYKEAQAFIDAVLMYKQNINNMVLFLEDTKDNPELEIGSKPWLEVWDIALQNCINSGEVYYKFLDVEGE